MNSITYISKSKIPSRHANSVQVVNMISAFSMLMDTIEVHLPGGLSQKIRLLTNTLFKNYGKSVPSNADVFFSKDSSSNKHHFEDNVLGKLRPNSSRLVFTRSPYVAWKLVEQQRPVIFESHWFSRDKKEIPLPRFASLISTSTNSGVVTTSPAITSAYIEAGLDQSRILTVSNSVDVDTFAKSQPGGLGKLFGPQVYQKATFVYTGSLGEGKGAQFLASASASLENIHVAIIGGNDKEIQNLRETSGNPSTLFLHPAVPHKDIPAILQDATGLIMPYSNEGSLSLYMCPLKMFEYLATGKPVISADLPAMKTILAHEQNAFLFQPCSTSSFKEQIFNILNMSDSQAKALRDKQFDTISRFTWANRAKTILDWHRGLLA
jgi:glycosyltransferase involved in cell wall biosynthesis